MSSIQAMPIEIFYHIFSFLMIHDMKQVIIVCKKWNKIGVDKKLWHSACRTIKHQTIKEAMEILSAGCRYYFSLFFNYKKITKYIFLLTKSKLFVGYIDVENSGFTQVKLPLKLERKIKKLFKNEWGWEELVKAFHISVPYAEETRDIPDKKIFTIFLFPD